MEQKYDFLFTVDMNSYETLTPKVVHWSCNVNDFIYLIFEQDNPVHIISENIRIFDRDTFKAFDYMTENLDTREELEARIRREFKK